MRHTFPWLATVAVVVLLLGAPASAASDPELRCRQAVLRGAAKLTHARLLSLRKCEDAKRAGKLVAAATQIEEALPDGRHLPLPLIEVPGIQPGLGMHIGHVYSSRMRFSC